MPWCRLPAKPPWRTPTQSQEKRVREKRPGRKGKGNLGGMSGPAEQGREHAGGKNPPHRE